MKRRLMMLLLALVGLTASAWADGGHAYIDLGLPSGTLWATENLVTTTENENDDLYQWGEAELPGFGISWSRYCSVESYVLYDSSSSRMAKYNAQDGLTELEEADDAASQQWGTEWCIPSKSQWEELMNSEYTTMEWGTDDGSNYYGFRITSRANGNSIFLPAAGEHSETSLDSGGKWGYYWSRTLDPYNSNTANPLRFSSASISQDVNDHRYNGHSIRPVLAQ